MVKSFINEEWKEISIEPGSLKKRYAVSNMGRVASFTDKLENGMVLKNREHGGYLSVAVKPFGKNVAWLIHRLVATYFLPPPAPDQKFVIHLDYNKKNNRAENLKWANQEEMSAHHLKSPAVIHYKKNKRNYINFDAYKLKETRVRLIKKILNDPNRKIKIKTLAKQFGISEMQLYRIKKGIHWGHVK
jgi:hypothetical protein